MAHKPATYADVRHGLRAVLQRVTALDLRTVLDAPAHLAERPAWLQERRPETEAEHVARLTGPDAAGAARDLRDLADALEALWGEEHDGLDARPAPVTPAELLAAREEADPFIPREVDRLARERRLLDAIVAGPTEAPSSAVVFGREGAALDRVAVDETARAEAVRRLRAPAVKGGRS